jgi:hypothetical protein
MVCELLTSVKNRKKASQLCNSMTLYRLNLLGHQNERQFFFCSVGLGKKYMKWRKMDMVTYGS